MLDNNYQPGFKSSPHLKDMKIVMETTKALGLALECAELATRHLQELMEERKGDLDSSAIKLTIS
jgi:3-hydroxyisobutyrate dehydrogenase-like beta-hydroxyacid dehydrogenase